MKRPLTIDFSQGFKEAEVEKLLKGLNCQDEYSRQVMLAQAKMCEVFNKIMDGGENE